MRYRLSAVSIVWAIVWSGLLLLAGGCAHGTYESQLDPRHTNRDEPAVINLPVDPYLKPHDCWEVGAYAYYYHGGFGSGSDYGSCVFINPIYLPDPDALIETLPKS